MLFRKKDECRGAQERAENSRAKKGKNLMMRERKKKRGKK